jgi:Na+/proline symporter
MINFGIFPAVSARLFMSIIGLPEHFSLGGLQCSTFVALTALMVVVPLGFIVMGGHTSVMVSNFMQGLFTNVAAVIIVAVLFLTVFDWNAIVQCLTAGGGKEASLLDPIHSSNTKDFNAWFFIINIIGGWYCAMSNVPSQAFLGSGKTAHEQRMGYLLGQISWQGLLVFFMMIALCSFTLMNNPAQAEVAAKITEAMKSAPPEVHDQIRVTSTLPALLPAGLVGLFCAIMMAALISSHNGFMHAWGGVLLQDIILPFRKQPLSTKSHLWALRAAIATVGLVAFVYSFFWKPNQSILMYFAMVNNVWLGPAGAVMLGGLYWKKGTSRAAVATLSLGALLGIGFIFVNSFWSAWHPQYCERSFAKPAAVVAQISAQARPVDQFVWSKIPPADQAELTALAADINAGTTQAESAARAAKPEEALKRKLAAVFNTAFLATSTGSILDGARFEGVKLSEELTKQVANASTVVANRAVLNAAYDSLAKEEKFPINGQYMFLITILFSLFLYGTVSWLDNCPAFNMDKMLHRGAYAIQGEALPELRPTRWWQTIFGITPMFNKRDRLTAYLIVGWFLAWLGVFAAGMVYGAVADPGEAAWAKFWHVYLYISFGLLVGSTVWLGVGGLRDLRNLLTSLGSTERDFSDDGRAAAHAPAEPSARQTAQLVENAK